MSTNDRGPPCLAAHPQFDPHLTLIPALMLTLPAILTTVAPNAAGASVCTAGRSAPARRCPAGGPTGRTRRPSRSITTATWSAALTWPASQAARSRACGDADEMSPQSSDRYPSLSLLAGSPAPL